MKYRLLIFSLLGSTVSSIFLSRGPCLKSTINTELLPTFVTFLNKNVYSRYSHSLSHQHSEYSKTMRLYDIANKKSRNIGNGFLYIQPIFPVKYKSVTELYAKDKKTPIKRPQRKKSQPPSVDRTKHSLEQGDREELEKEYEKHIAMADSSSYLDKIKLDVYQEDSKPFLTLFESEVMTKKDLIGSDLPFGMVPRERYELWKLCGHVSDPFHPISSQSLTTRIFIQRLFGKEYKITRDMFNYIIEYKMKFLTPGYGDIFFMDKVRCWRAWLLSRDLKEGPEDLPDYTSVYPPIRPDREVPLSFVMHRVNADVNRQGIHPAMLDMFWFFFTNDNVLTRDVVACKLNWVIDRLKNLSPGEGISPDNFYKIFYNAAKEFLEKFDKKSFVRSQLKNIEYLDVYNKMLLNNKALRERNKIITRAYNEETKGLYKPKIPDSYIRYERRRLAGYFNLLADMCDRQSRRKETSKDKKQKEVSEE